MDSLILRIAQTHSNSGKAYENVFIVVHNHNSQ